MLVGGSSGGAGGPENDPTAVSVELVSLDNVCSNSSSSSGEGPGPLPGPRMGGVAVAVDGQVLVCGGTDGGEATLASCLAWNMTLPSWSSFDTNDNDSMSSDRVAFTPPSASSVWAAHSVMNEGRLAGAATRLLNTVYVSGGSEEAHGIEHLDPAAEEEDNSSSSSWRYGPRLPDGVSSVYGHCSLPWGEDGLLFLGGVYTAAEIFVSRDVLLFNSTTSRWSTWPSLLARRRNLACARLANSSLILVAGGDNDSGDLAVSHQAEILEIGQEGGGQPPVGTSWRPVGRLVQGRKGGQLAVIHGGRIVLSGGFSAEVDGSGTFLDTMEEFSLETEAWTLLDQRLGLRRAAHGLTVVPDIYC